MKASLNASMWSLPKFLQINNRMINKLLGKNFVTSRSRLPAGLFGMIALIATIEFLIQKNAPEFTSHIAATWRWGAESARRDAHDAGILCFGDSLVKYGVVPRVLEGRTHINCQNLSILMGNAATSYILLNRALEAGSKPAALLIDDELMVQDPIAVPYLWPELATPLEAAAIAWEARDPAFMAAYVANRAVGSLRFRYEIRERLMRAFRGEPSDASLCYALNRRNWLYNKGAQIAPHFCTAPTSVLKDLETEYSRSAIWICQKLNDIHFNKFMYVAMKRGIPVIWILPPRHPEFEKRFGRASWEGLHRQYINGMMARYPNLMVVDGRTAGYDSTVVFDLVHMNRRGACAFSVALGDIISAKLRHGPAAGERWVNIPPYSEPGDMDAEDVIQSMAIVKKELSSLQR